MTHTERWKAAVHRKNFDRLPRFYLGTGEFTETLKTYTPLATPRPRRR